MNEGLFERLVNALERIATAMESGSASVQTEVTLVDGAEDAGKSKTTKKKASKKKTSKKKTSRKAAESEDEDDSNEPEATGDENDSEAEPPFEYNVLKNSILELVNMSPEGRNKALKVLNKYGVKKASDAPVSKWQDLLDDITEQVTALQGEVEAEEEDDDFV